MITRRKLSELTGYASNLGSCDKRVLEMLLLAKTMTSLVNLIVKSAHLDIIELHVDRTPCSYFCCGGGSIGGNKSG